MFDALHLARESAPFLLMGAWCRGLVACILNRRLSWSINLLVAGFGLGAAVWLLLVAILLGVGERLFSPSFVLAWIFLVTGLGQVTAMGLVVVGLVFLFKDFGRRCQAFKDLPIRQNDNQNKVQLGARISDEIQQ